MVALIHSFHAEARRAGGPSVRASCSCLASLVVCVPEAGASQVTCWRSRTRTVTSATRRWSSRWNNPAKFANLVPQGGEEVLYI